MSARRNHAHMSMSLSHAPNSQHTTISNNNGLHRLVSCTAWIILNRIHHIPTSGNFAKDTVFTIEMRRRAEAEEELGAVSVRASICHGEDATAIMLINEVLICEGASVVVDRRATSAIVVREIATLGHESSNDSVER